VTVLESRESEKGNNDSESSLSEAETEAREEAEVFSFVGTVFLQREQGTLLFCGRGGSLFLTV
jgi:hypothetical protein